MKLLDANILLYAYDRSFRAPRHLSHVARVHLQRPNIVVANAADRFWNILRQQILDAQVSGPLVTDAALAALAIEQGATLCSTDRDFRRFEELKLVDPTQRTN